MTPHLHAHARSVAGTLEQDVVVADRFHLRTDEPESVGGDDSAPAPHELIPAALASCIGTQLAMYARTKNWDLGTIDVDVLYEHRADPRVFTVSVALGQPVGSEQVERLQKVVETCPVRRALQGGARFVEHVSVGSRVAS